MASILVVDDHEANRDLLATVLGSAGHIVLDADGSEVALEIARRERPDLIISDILMPGIDGYEFVKRLRSDPDLAGTRVVFNTATYLESEARQLAAGYGVEHFLFNPCEPEQILEIVRLALNAGATILGPLAAGFDQATFDREHIRLVNDKLITKIAELEALNQRNGQLNTDLRASEGDVLAAEEAQRRRWARELHDETLQALGGLRVLLAAARRTGDPAALRRAADLAITQIEQEITNLRAIITELRPAALDELGLEPALEALFDRQRSLNDLNISAKLRLREGRGGADGLGAELPVIIYRVLQEALANVAKHAQASAIRVSVRTEERSVIAEVSDDGCGFAADSLSGGFGLTGMRERILIAGGTLAIDSSELGTTLTATLPLPHEAALAPTRDSQAVRA